MTGPAAAPVGTSGGALLHRPRLVLLYSGAALNAIGSWASLIALWGFAAYRFRSGPSGVALLGLAWTAPGAILSIVSGWPIDRFGPKATLIGSNVVGMATALAMAASGSYIGTADLAVAVSGVFLWGWSAASFMPPLQTLLQRSAPVEAHGRVMAITGAVNGLGVLVAIPLTGMAVGGLGIAVTGSLIGGLVVVAGVAGWLTGGTGRTAGQARAKSLSRAAASAG